MEERKRDRMYPPANSLGQLCYEEEEEETLATCTVVRNLRWLAVFWCALRA